MVQDEDMQQGSTTLNEAMNGEVKGESDLTRVKKERTQHQDGSEENSLRRNQLDQSS